MWQPVPLRIARTAPSWAAKKEELEARLATSGPWFHSLIFENGAQTLGRDPSEAKLNALQLPSNLSHYSLLDVGCYEGFFSFHAAQRGAEVTANDHFIWHQPTDPAAAHFQLAHGVVGAPCEVLDLDVLDVPSLGRAWDIVLFLGVLYHLPSPVAGLRAIRVVTRRVAILETLVDCLDSKGERCAFYHGLNNDFTNYFGPNIASVTAMAERAGFHRAEFRNIWELNTVSALNGNPTLSPVISGRAVFYLYP